MTQPAFAPEQTLPCLLAKYGPLMTAADLAAVLGRASEVSVRNQLRMETSHFSQLFKPTTIRVGRRLFFRTELVARTLDTLQPAN